MQNHEVAKTPAAINKLKNIGLSNDLRKLAAENC
jgi:hypothetical protein